MKKNKTLLLSVYIIFTTLNLLAQDTLFFNTYGDVAGNEEIENVIQTSDNQLVSIGFTDAYSVNGDGDAIVIKNTLNGQVVWTKIYGDTSDNMLLDIKETANGNLIAGGWTLKNGIDYDFWLLKLDAQGNVLWEKQYGGAGDDQIWSVDVLGNDFIVVGGTDSYGAGLTDVWVMRLDNNGNIIWQKTYGTSGDEAPPGNYQEFVARGFVDKNGRIVVSGITDGAGNGGFDIYVLQLDAASGNILWQKSYGNTDDESLWNFIPSKDGNYYYLPGNTISPSTFEGDMWLVKIDTTGTIVWQKSFGITGKWDEILNASATSDGILLSSYVENNTNDWSGALLKADNQGNLLWAKKYKTGNLDWINDCKMLNDSTLILAGVTTDTVMWNEDYLFIRTDKNGNIAGCPHITSFSPVETVTAAVSLNVNFLVNTTSATAISNNSSGTQVVFPENISACSEIINSVKQYQAYQAKIYPNPAGDNIVLEMPFKQANTYLTIYTIDGKKVKTVSTQKNIRTISIKELPEGIYFIEIFDSQNQYRSTLKFAVSR